VVEPLWCVEFAMLYPDDSGGWLAVRGRQLAAGELVYIAHQLDFAGRSPG
jgi:hypothetical protein